VLQLPWLVKLLDDRATGRSWPAGERPTIGGVRLRSTRAVLTVGRTTWSGDATGAAPGTDIPLGPGRLRLGRPWTITNRTDEPLAIRSVALVHDVDDVVGPLRMFRHGYQSWSPTGTAVFGIDHDPSTVPGSLEPLRAAHHADQRPADRDADELRSEWVTVLGDDVTRIALGFDGGHRHDGTFRLRRDGDGRPELWVEAFLGDAELPPGGSRRLHDVLIELDGSAPELLARWATEVGRRAGARVTAPHQVGWCSWYHYYDRVTEADVRHNLSLAAGDGWPFDVFQLDDGYQAGIGDWRETNDDFPSSLDTIAAAIAAAGFRPGLWVAPFLAAPDSQVVRDHPDWVARRRSRPDEPLWTWHNPSWGGGQRGFMYGLDPTNPEVLDHLERLAHDLVEAGFTYLKLDFTFSPSVDGVWFDPSRTPAERVRAGFDAIRRGAGDDAFLLGCGVPLAHVVGVVDANRIGQDVAPRWDPGPEVVPGYVGTQPATRTAYVNTLARTFQHRRLWLNDPDCIMLRTAATELTPDAARSWAQAVGLSGGLAIVSDDIALLGTDARQLFDEVLALGRESDAAAMDGRPATSPDLFAAAEPTTIVAGDRTLVTELTTGAGRMVAPT
jgi:alpha-galactosidase